MSYDLYFKTRTGKFSEEQFFQYFTGRVNYTIEGRQALYGNEDTGVYFIFELQDANDCEDTDLKDYPVVFNINFYRPSYFILEAEPEVTQFVTSLDLIVLDCQTEGMGNGDYDSQQLLKGWNHGNEFGYSAVLKENQGGKIFQLPSKRLHEIWKWNYQRELFNKKLGPDKFVPAVMFIELEGSLITMAVWPDGIPIASIPVDYLFVSRKEYAPRSFFRKKEAQTLLAWNDALPIFQKYGKQDANGVFILNYTTPPEEVGRFVRAIPPNLPEITRITSDQVLDQEMVEKHLK